MYSSRTFIALLGVAYFAGTQAQSSVTVAVSSNSSAVLNGSIVANVVTPSTAMAANQTNVPVATSVAGGGGGGGGGGTTVVVSATSAVVAATSAAGGGGGGGAGATSAVVAATSAAGGGGGGGNTATVGATSVAGGAVQATTAAAKPATSASVKPTEAPKKVSVITLGMTMKQTWSNDYKNKSSAKFKSLAKNITDALNATFHKHGLVNATVTGFTEGSVKVTLEMYFKVTSDSFTAEDVLKKELDNPKSQLLSLGVDKTKLDFTYPGVKLTEYKAKAGECAKKCCDGAGGSIEMERTCTPKESCGGIALTKTEKSCTTHCKEADCNSGTVVKTSMMTSILAILALIRTIA